MQLLPCSEAPCLFASKCGGATKAVGLPLPIGDKNVSCWALSRNTLNTKVIVTGFSGYSMIRTTMLSRLATLGLTHQPPCRHADTCQRLLSAPCCAALPHAGF